MANQDQIEDAIDELRSDNMLFAKRLKRIAHASLNKTEALLQEAESINEVQTAVNISKTISEIFGLSRKEEITNIQLNAITGFEFVEIEPTEPIKQIEVQPAQDAVIIGA